MAESVPATTTVASPAVPARMSGRLPEGMRGTFLRIGPQPEAGESEARWGSAAGMLHVIDIADDAATYRHSRMGPFAPGATLLLERAEILATGERGPVWTLDPRTWQGHALTDIPEHFTVPHAHHDSTGALLQFSLFWLDARLAVTRRVDGRSVPFGAIELPRAHYLHDIAIVHGIGGEPDVAVLGLHPLVRTMQGLEWDSDAESVWLVRELGDGKREWSFATEPCYTWHSGMVRRDGDVITIRTPARPESGILGSRELSHSSATGAVREWTLDLESGRSSHRDLSDLPADFPVDLGDDLVIGLARPRAGMFPDYTRCGGIGVLAPDGSVRARMHPADSFGGEFIPVSTNEGTVLTGLVSHADRTDLLVLDPHDLTGEPLATVTIPLSVPPGLHAAWLAGGEGDR